MAEEIYQFGPFRLDVGSRLLLRDATPVAITPKVFDTLVFLVANAGRTVPREELIQAVWTDTFVEEGNLNYNMSQLRKILGEREPGVPYVQTIPKVGYRFVADTSVGAALAQPIAPAPVKPRRRLHPRIMAAGIVLVFISAALWIWNSRSQSKSAGPKLYQLTHDDASNYFPALSPDAKLVAYMSDRAEPGRSDIWVQQTSGGPPLRLTKGPAVNQFPMFSADGSKIYFSTLSSTPEGAQGIYEVSSLGGQPRLIAAGGFWPRVSPDGRSIAFIAYPSLELSIMPADGGSPRTFAPGFSLLSIFGFDMIWSPDGRQICFFGQKTGQPQTLDYWVVGADGGSPERTRWIEWAHAHRVEEGTVDAWLPGDVILASLQIGDTSQIYRMPFARRGWKFLREPETLTVGTGRDGKVSVSGGKIAFESGVRSEAVWIVPADTDRGQVTGGLEKLTTERSPYSDAAMTSDGKTLVFCSKRAAATDIYVRDMHTGEERVLVTDREEKRSLLISMDGSVILYTTQTTSGDPWPVYSVPAGGGPHRKICADCGPPRSLSPDGKRFLATDGSQPRITQVNVDSGRSIDLLSHPRYPVDHPSFSPDGKWIAFMLHHDTGADLAVAPLDGGTPIPQNLWITVASTPDPPGFSDVFWSPNGELLYYVRPLGSQTNLMAQRLDRGHHATGAPFLVHGFRRVHPRNAGVAFQRDRLNAVPGRLVGTMSEDTSNIWLMDLPR